MLPIGCKPSHYVKVVLVTVSVLLGISIPSYAQGFGLRGGVSVDPDQFYFGGHYETPPVVDRLHFRPNLELGVGDDVFTTTLNFEFVYKFPVQRTWRLYAGAGPAVNFYSYDGGDSTDPGLNILLGAEVTNGLFFEFKVGTIDSPELKFGVGYTFK